MAKAKSAKTNDVTEALLRIFRKWVIEAVVRIRYPSYRRSTPISQQVIVFSAGVSVTSKQPDAVNELLKLLTSPASAAVLKSKGLDAP